MIKRLIWRSIFGFPIGYAIHSRQMAMALETAGVEVIYRYAYGPGTVFPKLEPRHFENGTLSVMQSRRIHGHEPVVVYGQPDVFQFAVGSQRIGFTMLEANGLPREWVKYCNGMDEVWVPSSFNEKTFQAAGVTKPIRRVPLGIDPAIFKPDGLSMKRDDLFGFISVFEWGYRKDPEKLLRAFNDEFRLSEPIGLFCKIFTFDPTGVRRYVREMGLKENGGKIFLSINEQLTDVELAALYRSMDCFVLPTRGEGWGMPFLEATACGLPVIATNWSAHLDFLNKENAYLIEVESMIKGDPTSPYVKDLECADASYEHLRKLMRKAVENRAADRSKALIRAEEVRKQFSWDQTAAIIIDNLDRLCS